MSHPDKLKDLLKRFTASDKANTTIRSLQKQKLNDPEVHNFGEARH